MQPPEVLEHMLQRQEFLISELKDISLALLQEHLYGAPIIIEREVEIGIWQPEMSKQANVPNSGVGNG